MPLKAIFVVVTASDNSYPISPCGQIFSSFIEPEDVMTGKVAYLIIPNLLWARIQQEDKTDCMEYVHSGNCTYGGTCKYHPLVGCERRVTLNNFNFPLYLDATDSNHYLQDRCSCGFLCKYNHLEPPLLPHRKSDILIPSLIRILAYPSMGSMYPHLSLIPHHMVLLYYIIEYVYSFMHVMPPAIDSVLKGEGVRRDILFPSRWGESPKAWGKSPINFKILIF